MRLFSINELHEHSDEVTREADNGRIALMTRDGLPLFIAVPCNTELFQWGIRMATAVNLHRSGELTAARAARLAQVSLQKFCAHLGKHDIPMVDYPPEEISHELAIFSAFD